jgi:hypothetical protein
VFHWLHRELNNGAEFIEVMRATQAKGILTATPAHAGAVTKCINLFAPHIISTGLTHAFLATTIAYTTPV